MSPCDKLNNLLFIYFYFDTTDGCLLFFNGLGNAVIVLPRNVLFFFISFSNFFSQNGTKFFRTTQNPFKNIAMFPL